MGAGLSSFKARMLADELALRGTGQTAKAMREAAPNAVFVWCNDRLFYPRDLARHLNRHDLQIVAPHWLRGSMGWRPWPVVVDHAFRPTFEQAARIDWLAIRWEREQERIEQEKAAWNPDARPFPYL